VGKEQRTISTTSSRPKPSWTRSPAETGVPRRRHGDGGQLQLDLRRRGGAGADAPSEAHKRGLKPLAVIHGHAALPIARPVPGGTGRRDRRLMTRPVGRLDEVDLFEINEAFAVVSLVTMTKLEIPTTRSMCTAAPAPWATRSALRRADSGDPAVGLRQNGLKRGVAAICIGGGEATAMAVECLY
jgi:acetyl-CoA C-acetyltransferase